MKLHRVVVMLTRPVGKYPEGTGVGGLMTYAVFKKFCAFVLLPPLVVTTL